MAATPDVSPNTTDARFSTDLVHLAGREFNFNHSRLRMSGHGFSNQGHPHVQHQLRLPDSEVAWVAEYGANLSGVTT
jgi:hypothetical protein